MSEVFDLARTPIEDGTTLIEASAGTGKTYTITGLVLRLLLEGHVKSIGEVLVVTFTIAATEELKGRMRETLQRALRVYAGTESDAFLEGLRDRFGPDGEACLSRALQELDDVGISTIHGFCRRVLEQSAFESGTPFTVEFIVDDLLLLRRSAEDFWRRRLYGASPCLVGLVVSRRLDPSTFLEGYKKFHRHPHTRLRPEPGDLDPVVAEMETIVSELGPIWDATAVARDVDRLDPGDLSPEERKLLVSRLEGLHRGELVLGLEGVFQLAKLIADGEGSQGIPDLHAYVQACVRLARVAERVEAALRGEYIAEVRRLFNAEKHRRGVLTFDDLLDQLHAALQDARRGSGLTRSIRRTYRVALIDEFQDTDLTQYEIFRAIFAEGPLFLIGDPKQAIYGFRGADIFAYLAAKRDARRQYTLDRNWRSQEDLVAGIGAIWSRIPRPFVFEDIPFVPVTAAGKQATAVIEGDPRPPLQWWFLEPKRKGQERGRAIEKKALRMCAFTAVTRECVRLLQGKFRIAGERLHAGNIAVIVRSNADAEAMQGQLRDAGIPSVIGRSGDVLRSREADELETVLAGIARPQDGAAVRAALSTELWGESAVGIHRLRDDEPAWQALIEEVEGFRERWTRHGFLPMFEEWLRDRSIRVRLLSRFDGERRITNLQHAAEFIAGAERERDLSPEGLLEWFAAERTREPDDPERRQLRLESDAPSVQIVTVHASKGLEYDIVFCPTLWDSRQPKKKAAVLAHADAGTVVFDHHSETFDDAHRRAECEQVAEDLRLAYVALTRARFRAYVMWGETGRRDTVPALAYLLHAPAEETTDEDGLPRWLDGMLKRLLEQRPRWGDQLQRQVEARDRCMALERWTERPEAPERIARDDTDPGAREARTFPASRRIRPWWIASYSSLVAGAEAGVSGASGSGAEGIDHLDPDTDLSEEAAEDAGGIFAFARGARAGSAFHEILERLDPARVAEPGTTTLIEEVLARHGLETPEAHRDLDEPIPVVQETLERVCRVTLPGLDRPLEELDASRSFREWPFHLGIGGTERRPVDGRALSRLLTRHGSPRLKEGYAQSLATLRTGELRGFLSGVVDLVVEHEGRWLIVDWKSNHLGSTPGSYDDAPVWEAMSSHHYVLQYHLYLAALHRFLKLRQPGYDYDEHLVGACYVFLRGVDGESARGLFHDRPPRAVIEALDHWLAGEGDDR